MDTSFKTIITSSHSFINGCRTATLLLKSDNIIRVKHDIIAAIFYVSNWWYIAKDVNYFEQFSFMPLKHLWSLAIEEQFYIFFPVILVTLLLTIKKRYKIGFIFGEYL